MNQEPGARCERFLALPSGHMAYPGTLTFFKGFFHSLRIDFSFPC